MLVCVISYKCPLLLDGPPWVAWHCEDCEMDLLMIIQCPDHLLEARHFGVGGFRRFMVVAKGMAPTHHTSARAVVPFHATSYYSCRRCSSLISIPRGNSAVTLLSLATNLSWLLKFVYRTLSLCCSGCLITSQWRRDLDQVARRVVVEAWVDSSSILMMSCLMVEWRTG